MTCPSVNFISVNGDIDAIIRNMTSDLLCPIADWDIRCVAGCNDREQLRVVGFSEPRFGRSMRPLDRKARPYGMVAVDSAKRWVQADWGGLIDTKDVSLVGN